MVAGSVVWRGVEFGFDSPIADAVGGIGVHPGVADGGDGGLQVDAQYVVQVDQCGANKFCFEEALLPRCTRLLRI